MCEYLNFVFLHFLYCTFAAVSMSSILIFFLSSALKIILDNLNLSIVFKCVKHLNLSTVFNSVHHDRIILNFISSFLLHNLYFSASYICSA